MRKQHTSLVKTPNVAASQKVGTCCRELFEALTVDPYLDPERANLYVLDGRLYICVYGEQGERFEEPVTYCPWCAKRISPPEPEQAPAHASFGGCNSTISS